MKRRILLLGSYAPSLVNFRGPLIRDLVAAGHFVVAAAPEMTNEIRAALKQLGAESADTPLERTGFNIFQDIAYRNQVEKVIREHSVDLLISYTIKPNIWGAFAAARRGIESVAMITGLGFAFTGAGHDVGLLRGFRDGLASRAARILYRRSTGHNTHVVFQNPDDRRDFTEAGCLTDPTKCVMTAGSGVDTNHYNQQTLPDDPVFLMTARLLGNKGVREYVQAAMLAKREIPAARFQLAGYIDEGPDGVAPSELESWIQDGVDYLGPLDDVRPSLGRCNVFVLPSYREGTPRSVLEAMSAGRAIITSDAPGCRETVRDGDNGFLVPVRDVPALADKMKILAENPALRRSMGSRSREIAVETYDSSKVNRKLMQDLDISL